jgi:thiol-disulfide isomerase/thioredoxin
MTDPAKQQKSYLPFLLAFLVGAFGVYWFGSSKGKVETPQATQTAPAGGFSRALATGPMAAVIVHSLRKDIPAFDLAAADGSTVNLSKWKGRVVLLNLWATWCAPCRKEIPDLVEVQKILGGPEFEVVTLSVDRKGYEPSLSFLKDVKAETLALYTDTEMKSMAALQAIGLPATVLIDKQGKEAARLLGPAPWSSAEAQTMIKALVSETP